MDQVVGGVHAIAGAAQAVGIEHIALVEVQACVRETAGARAAAHQTAHVETALGQIRGQPASDETGGAGDENASHAVTSERALRSQAISRRSRRIASVTASTTT